MPAKRSIKDWVKVAEELARKNSAGKLPSSKSLRDAGYAGLTASMTAHPELFKNVGR